MIDEETREAMCRLIARGEFTLTDAAIYAGVAVQTVDGWCRARAIDAKQARRGFIMRRGAREVRRLVKASS